MNIQEENSARYFRVQSEYEQTLVNGFSVTSFRTFSKTPYFYYTGGRYRGAGRN